MTKPTLQHPRTPILKTLIRGFLIAVLLIAADIAARHLWQMIYPTPRLVSIDLDGLVRGFIAETAKSDLPDAQKRARTQAFAGDLEAALQGLARRQHSVILSAPAVIAGVEDLTDAVRKGLKQ